MCVSVSLLVHVSFDSPASSSGAQSSCDRDKIHAVAVGCGTCSCGAVVGLATGPPSPTEQKSPVVVGLQDMKLWSGETLVVAFLVSGMQPALLI